MSKKQITKIIDKHLYEQMHKISIRIIVCEHYQYFENEVKKILPDYHREVENSLQGTCIIYAGGGSAFLWLRKNDTGVLVHELLHIIFDVLTQRGYTYSKDSEELYCYMLQYFLDEFHKKK